MIKKKCPYCGEEISSELGSCYNCKELIKKKAENLIYNPNNKEVERHKSTILSILSIIAILFAFISFGQDIFGIFHPITISNSIIVSIKNIFEYIPEWFTFLISKTILIILLGAIIKYYYSIIKSSHLFIQLIFLELLLGILELLSSYQSKDISYALMVLIPMVSIYIMVIMFLIGIRLIKSTKKKLLYKLGIGFIGLSITIPLELILILFFWKIAAIGILLNLFFMVYTFSQINNLFKK